MAEAVLFGVAEKLLETLGSLIIQEVVSDWGARDELQKLVDKVRIIRGVLLDAEHREQDNDTIKLWLEALRSLVYDADDLADEISAIVRKQNLITENKILGKVRVLFSRSNPLLLNYELAGKVKLIRERLDVMAPNMTSLLNLGLKVRLVDEQLVAQKERKRSTYSYVRREDIVGREEDERKLVDLLLKDPDEGQLPRVISVSSIGGLGKTALAQLVCQNKLIQQHFKLTVWVCISDNFDVELIVQSIVKEIMNKPDISKLIATGNKDDDVKLKRTDFLYEGDSKVEEGSASKGKGIDGSYLESSSEHPIAEQSANIVALREEEPVSGAENDGNYLMMGSLEQPTSGDTIREEGKSSSILVPIEKRNGINANDGHPGERAIRNDIDEHNQRTAGITLPLQDIRGTDHVDGLQLGQLGPMLQKTLGQIRYMIVLDDVWNESLERWLELRKFLEGSARGSRVLVTTRHERVARIMGCSRPDIHRLQPLKPEDSWTLFSKLVFDDLNKEHRSKIAQAALNLGREIVKKCSNHPLTIRSVASAIRESKDDDTDWKSIMETELLKLNSNTNNSVLHVLRLSYNHLPSVLKHCFAFCALFPQDYQMPEEWLVQLWLAQGFLQQGRRRISTSNNSSIAYQNLEDIAHGYLEELLRRDFFLEGKKDLYGNVGCYKVHDLMHDLAKEVAGQQTILADAHTIDEFDPGVLHVSIKGMKSKWKVPPSLLKAKQLRTFIIHSTAGTGAPHITKSDLDAIFKRFKYLRVLGLQAVVKSASLPSSIGTLKLLHFLDLSLNDALVYIPDTITQLINLQTLDLHGCRKLQSLPYNGGKLVSLQNLDISGCDSLFTIRQCGKKSYLAFPQSLSRHFQLFKACFQRQHSWWKSGSHVLTLKGHLSTLEGPKQVHVKVDPTIFYENNEVHENIKVLEITGYEADRLPCWQINESPTLSSLTRITITSCRYCTHLPAFSQLPTLEVLVLKQMESLRFFETIYCNYSSSSSFFPCLTELDLSDLPILVGWLVESYQSFSSFPALTILTILNCPNIECFPSAPKLKESTLKGVSEDLKQMITKGLSFTNYSDEDEEVQPQTPPPQIPPLPQFTSNPLSRSPNMLSFPYSQRVIEKATSNDVCEDLKQTTRQEMLIQSPNAGIAWDHFFGNDSRYPTHPILESDSSEDQDDEFDSSEDQDDGSVKYGPPSIPVGFKVTCGDLKKTVEGITTAEDE